MRHYSLRGVSAAAVAFLIPAVGAGAEEMVFPADARIVRVTDFGATPDDGKDDTEAIRAAIAQTVDGPSRYAAPRFIYLPKGVYDISGPIEARIGTGGWSHGWRSGFMLIGQSRAGTVLRLQDGAEGFGDPAAPKAVLSTGSENPHNVGGGGNQAFRQNILHLTVDTGRGNLGAVGIDYLANNRGTVKNVTIRSGDGRGHAGILLTRSWPGPALIKNVAIEGFDHGLVTGHYQYSMTIERLTLKGQKVSGIRNPRNVLAIRGLTSVNSVPVIEATVEHGHITLLDADFTGGAATNAAILNKGKLFVRNLTSIGYGTVIDNQAGGKGTAADGPGKRTISEFVSHPVVELFPGAGSSLNLPIEETPEFNATDLTRWANGEKYGATANNDQDDDAAGIQAAIDSGKPVVYLPNGHYQITKTIILRGGVRKIIGMQSSIGPKKGVQVDPLIRFEDGAAETVILEHLWLDGVVEHASSRGLAVKHADLAKGYRNTPAGTGKLFLEDVIGKPYRILHPQSVWGRQVNCEFGDDPLIENHGGALWILGYKTEGQMTVIKTVGGATELLGALIYPLRAVPSDVPMFLNDGGRVSLSYAHNGSHNYPIHVLERRGAEERTLSPKQVPGRGPALYVGYEARENKAQ